MEWSNGQSYKEYSVIITTKGNKYAKTQRKSTKPLKNMVYVTLNHYNLGWEKQSSFLPA